MKFSSGSNRIDYGSTKNSPPLPAQSISIINNATGGDGQYAEGVLTIEDQQYINKCHLDFKLSGASWSWHPHPLLGDNCSAVPTDPKNNTLGIGKPTQSSGSGNQPSLYPQLDSKMVYMVDTNKKTGNMLFRGNNPFTSGMSEQRVDFKALDTAMREKFSQELTTTASFPKKYILIDVSLISSGSEGGQLYDEYLSFGQPATPHKVMPIPSEHWVNQTPYTTANGYQARMLFWSIEPNSPQTHVDLLAKKLNELMTQQHDVPYVIYIHCSSGHDRTAIAAVTYLMDHYKMSLDKAYIYGTTLEKLAVTMKNSQIKPTAYIDNTATVSKNKSRLFPISTVYDTTMVTVCHQLGLTECTLTARDQNKEKPVVFSDYPWNLNQG